jgi:hypothetical protein
MGTYAVRGLLTGTVYGRHLSATEAAAAVLRHATRRYAIRRADEDCYRLWVEINNHAMEIAYSCGRPIGVCAETKEAAWPTIASQVLEAEWPGILISPEDPPSSPLAWDKEHAASISGRAADRPQNNLEGNGSGRSAD